MGARRVAGLVALVVLSGVIAVPMANAAPPSNDDRANAAAITSLPFEAEVDLREATTESDEPVCEPWWGDASASQVTMAHRLPVGLDKLVDPVPTNHGNSIMARTVWYSLEPDADGRVSADTFQSDDRDDTMLAAYEVTSSGLVQLACNDDVFDLQSRIAFSVRAGTRYLIQLGSFWHSANAAHLRVEWVAERGTIVGTVTDDETGLPIANACVEILNEYEWEWTETAADGTYSLRSESVPTHVVFGDCDIRSSDTHHYPWEWWDNAATFAEATAVAVTPGTTVGPIDAGLTLAPMPIADGDLAVTNVEVAPDAFRVTSGVSVGDPAVAREITVDIANVGDRLGIGSVNVSICGASTPSSCIHLSPRLRYLWPGDTDTFAFRWNGVGGVGDVDVTATINGCDPQATGNNTMTVRDETLGGGHGAGATTASGRQGHPPWCTYVPFPYPG